MFDPGLTLGQDHADWSYETATRPCETFLLPQLTLENVAKYVVLLLDNHIDSQVQK